MFIKINFKFQIEGIYTKAHSSIREDPAIKKKEEKAPPARKKRWNRAKLTNAERKNRVAQKKASFIKKLEAGQAEP